MCAFLYLYQHGVIPSELSVMRVTFWPFCALLDWPPLETQSLASEPLSCSSWLSSGPGTFTRMVLCRLLVTVLQQHIFNASTDPGCPLWEIQNRYTRTVIWTKNCAKAISDEMVCSDEFGICGIVNVPLTCWADYPVECLPDFRLSAVHCSLSHLFVGQHWETKTNCFISNFHWTFNLSDCLGAYHRTLFQVWVAPWGDPATIGTWIGLLAQGAMLSSLRPRALHVASSDCSFNSIPSSRCVIDPVNEINKFWK